MSRLSEFSSEAQKLLRMVANDVGITATGGTWVAQDFYNQGLGFDAAYQLAEVNDPEVVGYMGALDAMSSVDRGSNWTVSGIKPTTLVQYARVTNLASEGENVRLGIYKEDASLDVEWKVLQKDRAVAIIEHYQEWIEYRGMIQGIIHSLFKEASPPYFVIRDMASKELIRCVFSPSTYPGVHEALKRKNGVVLVSGWTKARRIDRCVDEIKVERLQATEPLNVDKLKAFFGSAPGWTGDLTSDDLIEQVRNDREHGE